MTEQPGLAAARGVATPARRGPKPAHSVEEIVQVALRLADADGIEAVSLPRIAGQIGVTANALYRYVSSKDELLLLLHDAGFGRAPRFPAGADWRGVATEWVQAIIARYRQHPWLLDLLVRGAPVTPHLRQWAEALLDGLADSALRNDDKLGCAVLLDGYARSTAVMARDLAASQRSPVQSQAVSAVLQPMLRNRGFPILAEMLATGEYRDSRDELADFGLDRILDGIDVLIQRRRHRRT
ncbi:MAG TPA: TetR/AcrR family transcriptional regulator [Mycobacteriales bacterium]|nr:TetR/AcrR family transcriptional regulator [Mycobacteriales bacterium]